MQDYGIHDWNAERFRVLGRLRKQAMQRAMELGCAYYFNPDADNFLRPCTLRELVSLNLPIVAPFLRSIDPSDPYSNYHAEIDQNGYYAECDQFHWALNRWVRGVIEMPVVHSTYLVRGDVLPLLDYEDGSGRHDYVVFSERARNAGVTQYLDNRQSYGFIGRDDPETDATTARRLLAEELETARQQGPRDDTDGEASNEDWRRHVIIG